MTVIVKGMKMPEKCQYCGFLAYYANSGNVWCNATNRLIETGRHTEIDIKRQADCPLVEIPVPHGDLIDKEKLYNTTVNLEAQALAQTEKLIHSEDISEWKRWSAILNERTAFKHDLLDAQTVIEAEEDQNEN